MKKQSKEVLAILECFRRLYKEATPSADFDKLLEEAPLNKDGQRVIDFNSYEIGEEICMAIIEQVRKDFKLPKRLKQTIQVNVLLGCSPRFKKRAEV